MRKWGCSVPAPLGARCREPARAQVPPVRLGRCREDARTRRRAGHAPGLLGSLHWTAPGTLPTGLIYSQLADEAEEVSFQASGRGVKARNWKKERPHR